LAAAVSRASRLSPLALPSILVVAAVNFFWQLGSSSYYVDEALSIEHALPPLHDIDAVVRMSESTPWTYFVGLHEWIYRTGSQAEWVLRLPSALAGLGLVAAVYWLGRLLAGRSAALIAASLVALSPLVLQYAQQVRVYVFLMLAVTVAVAASVSATRSTRRPGRWLLVAGAASVLATWLHYTGVFVIAPLAIWVGLQPGLRRSARAAFIATNALALIPLVPLYLDQRSHSPEGQLVGIPGLTWTTAAQVLGTPFDGRTIAELDAFRVIGVLVIATSVVAVTIVWRRRRLESWGLLSIIAVAPLAALLALGIDGQHVVLTRYTAVAAPFLLIILAIAVTRLPLRWGGALAIAALAVAIAGVVRTHQPSGYHLDAKGAIDFIQQHRRPNDTVITPGSHGSEPQFNYYAARRLRPLPRMVGGNNPQAVRAILRAKQRTWTITARPAGADTIANIRPSLRRALAPLGYDIGAIRLFPSLVPLLVTLLRPLRRRPA